MIRPARFDHLVELGSLLRREYAGQLIAHALPGFVKLLAEILRSRHTFGRERTRAPLIAKFRQLFTCRSWIRVQAVPLHNRPHLLLLRIRQIKLAQNTVFGIRKAEFYRPSTPPEFLLNGGTEKAGIGILRTPGAFDGENDGAFTNTPAQMAVLAPLARSLYSTQSIEKGPETPAGVHARVVDGKTLYVNTTEEEDRSHCRQQARYHQRQRVPRRAAPETLRCGPPGMRLHNGE